MNTEKQQVIEIIYKFYVVSKRDKNRKWVPCSSDWALDYDYKRDLTEEFNAIAREDEGLLLNKIVPIFQEILNKYSDKYDEIVYRVLSEGEGAYMYPQIVGIRKETDKELAKRIKEEEKAIKNEQLTMLKIQEEKAQKEKELFEELKKKYGKKEI